MLAGMVVEYVDLVFVFFLCSRLMQPRLPASFNSQSLRDVSRNLGVLLGIFVGH